MVACPYRCYVLSAYHLTAGVHGHRGGRHSDDFHAKELSGVLRTEWCVAMPDGDRRDRVIDVPKTAKAKRSCMAVACEVRAVPLSAGRRQLQKDRFPQWYQI